MDWPIPDMSDVLLARQRIAPFLQPTPLFSHPALCELLGTDVWVKHENHQATAAFKVRGGINLISTLSDEERRRGVAAASTGNHGQSVAHAAKLFGVRAVVVVPEGANPIKVAAMRGLGAEVIERGHDFDAAREYCAELAASRGYRYIHSGNEPLLIAGVATLVLEILEREPDIDVLIGPLGGGSGMAGASVVRRAIRPQMQLIAVQAAAAPAGYRSWKARALVEDRMETAAEGLATRTAFELPQRMLWDELDDFVLASEEELMSATRSMIEATKTLVEPAGAAPLAAAIKIRDRLAGKRVALVCSGGNISPAQLKTVMA